MSEATAALMGDNGGGGAPAAPTGTPAPAPAWYGEVDPQTAEYIANKGWDQPVKAIESYRNLEKFAGGSKSLLEIPGPDAPPEKMAEFYGKLGRPNSPDEYGLKPGEGADPEMVDWFKSTAHELGLNSKQAQSLFGKYQEMAGSKIGAMQEETARQSQADIEGLRREWGQAFDQQIAAGKMAVTALGFDKEKLDAYEAKLGTGEMLKLFATLGSKMGEPGFADGDRGSGAGFNLTPGQAQQQLADLKADKQFMDAYLTGSKEHVAKMQRLMTAAYANG